MVLCSEALNKSLLYMQGIIRDGVFSWFVLVPDLKEPDLAPALICFSRVTLEACWYITPLLAQSPVGKKQGDNFCSDFSLFEIH